MGRTLEIHGSSVFPENLRMRRKSDIDIVEILKFEMGKVVNNLVIDTGAQKSPKLQNDSSTLLTKKYGRVSIYLHSRPGLNLV